jgi:hypothetical protein
MLEQAPLTGSIYPGRVSINPVNRDPLADLDIDAWSQKFHITFVAPATMGQAGDAVALHRLTWWGPRLGIGEWDIWIAADCQKWARYLLLHEAVENWLRRRGWKYTSSHQTAVKAERQAFGREPEWHWYMANV